MKTEHSFLSDVPYNALEQKLQDFRQFQSQFFNKQRKKGLGKLNLSQNEITNRLDYQKWI